ncbi:MAG TPA: hypothetical protein DEQ38_09610 [Elusimicrobia bacterium]|nr:MAG: hypothetical protein A2089_04225 [Elusimicrobia bacterium GWD2_63_28]HCC48352.1 hypothetical protein [Elusimicrobiota bacterium]
MSSYAVILKDPAAPLAAAVPFLAGLKGQGRDPAAAFARANPGFLGRSLPLEAARALASGAAAAGFKTIIAAETDLPAPPPELAAVKIEPGDGGFHARTPGALTFIPYETVTIFSAAAWDAAYIPDTLQALKPGLFARIAALAGAGLPPPAAPVRETCFRADIIGGEVPLRVVLRPEALDFSPLGPARGPSSLENFRALLELLAAPCFQAVKNDFLPAFLAGRQLAGLKVASEEAAGLELSRLLLAPRGGAFPAP